MSACVGRVGKKVRHTFSQKEKKKKEGREKERKKKRVQSADSGWKAKKREIKGQRRERDDEGNTRVVVIWGQSERDTKSTSCALCD